MEDFFIYSLNLIDWLNYLLNIRIEVKKGID